MVPDDSEGVSSVPLTGSNTSTASRFPTRHRSGTWKDGPALDR
jgi:hypothetical protein